MPDAGDRPRAGPASVNRPTDVELFDLAVEIGAFDAERLRRIAHAPTVMLQDRGNVVALESLSGFAQGARWTTQRFSAFEPDVRQHVFQEEHAASDDDREPFGQRTELGHVPRPGQRRQRGGPSSDRL